MKLLPAFCFLYFFCPILSAQVTGHVFSEQGEPLPFAAVYLEGSTKGTSTNADGKYSLQLPEGIQTLVARYIGYEANEKVVHYSGDPVQVDFYLERESFELDEVVVSAFREDPAYAIIRKAIEKRPYYLDLIQSYRCEVYIKGAMALSEVPNSFMGQEITDNPEEYLDSLGLLYLSETNSEYFVRKPNDRKEVVHSSIVAGSDQGLSFNTAFFLSSNLYKNAVEIVRPVVSPIARNAMSYYEYKLLGESTDTTKRTVYKIAVIPKRPEEAVFGGVIYINDSLWNIQSADLYVTGPSLNRPIFDTLRLRKSYVPVRSPDAWMPISHEITFDLSALGFGVNGRFIGLFSDYETGMDFPKGFFNHEMIRYTDSAKKLSQQFWDSIRPIPLSVQEKEDYRVKDSIRQVRSSPEYLDSVDKVSNTFEFGDILGGYTYRRRTRQIEWTIGSPIGISGFDAVRGLHIGWPQNFRSWDENRPGKDWRIDSRILYSFGDEVLRGNIALHRTYDPKFDGEWFIRAGKEVQQFSDQNPVLPLINSFESVINKVHKLKIYERYGVEAGIMQELMPGFNGSFRMDYFHRNSLHINSTYSLFGNDEPFNSNLPDHPDVDSSFFSPHKSLSLDIRLEYTPGQKYLSLPNQQISLGSRWPTFTLEYRKGLGIFDSEVNYDFLSVSANKTHDLGMIGSMSWRVKHGRFLSREQLYFMDYAHFLGNETFIGLPSDYVRGFQKLSYYGRSTTDPFTTLHFEHAFEGYVFDKIPLLRKSHWELHIGGRSLIQDPVYSELSVGVSNIGIGVFRPFRADVVFSFDREEYIGAGFLLGINLLSREGSSSRGNGISISF